MCIPCRPEMKQHYCNLRLLACRWPREQGGGGGWHQRGWDRPCRPWTQGQRWNVLCSCVYSCGVLNTWIYHTWYVAGIWMMHRPEAGPACNLNSSLRWDFHVPRLVVSGRQHIHSNTCLVQGSAITVLFLHPQKLISCLYEACSGSWHANNKVQVGLQNFMS